MIEEIKKRLEAGEVVELECVDIDGLLDANKSAIREWKSEATKGIARVAQVEESAGIIELISSGGLGWILFCHDLKYFRIKRPTPTFDGLIDVAVKAVKDKALFTMSIGDSRRKGRYLNYAVSGSSPSESFYENDGCHQSAINFINSLYTETFVIENEEDINKVLSRKEIGFNRKSMSVATLMNGNEILITRLDPDNTAGIVVYMRDGLYKNYLGIDVLKGATVTQKRGKQ